MVEANCVYFLLVGFYICTESVCKHVQTPFLWWMCDVILLEMKNEKIKYILMYFMYIGNDFWSYPFY